jgi:hypothetical protein
VLTRVARTQSTPVIGRSLTTRDDVDWLFVENAFVKALRNAGAAHVASTPQEETTRTHKHSFEDKNSIERVNALNAPIIVSSLDPTNMRSPTYLQKAPLWCRVYRPDLIMRTVLSFMSENENLAALDDEKVIIRGKYLLRVMATATEYREHGEIVTCAAQWNWRVEDFSRRVLYFIQFIRHKWPNIDWHMFSAALHEHVLLLRKQSATTIRET